MSDYTPKPWKRGQCYIGATWEGWFVFLGQHRDSCAMDRCNFNAALQILSPLSTEIESGEDEGATVRIVRENHWAVGWVEWIAIHGSNAAALAEANRIAERLESYPVLDDDALCIMECEEYWRAWVDFGHGDLVKALEREGLIEEGALDDATPENTVALFESLIPSGDYHMDGAPNIRHAIEYAKRNGLPDKECEACGLSNE